jgi:hypothetical protein
MAFSWNPLRWIQRTPKAGQYVGRHRKENQKGTHEK